MKATGNMQKSTKKVVNALLGVMVLAGIIVFSCMNKTHTDGELMSKLFLIFFGFIITVQIVPGLFLFGAMLKEVFSFNRKEAVRK